MGNENKTPFENDEGIYSKPTKAVPAPEKNIGVDTDSELLDSIVTAGTSSQLDISALESFLNVSRGRNAVYNLLDSMGEDSQISAVLESYAEDATEYNANGQIVWVESDDENVAQFVQYLLDTMNVDKHIYGWAYSLCKYGDLYLRLFRESDYEDPIFGNNDTKKRLDEAVGGEKLDESVKVVAHSKNDRYSHYVEKVANPASMFELTKHGKTYGYIKADSGAVPTINEVTQQQWYQYKFQQTDVEVYSPCDYVHAYLEDDSGRTVEEVNISVNKDDENKEYTYQVKRGQSILYNVFKIWRELMLLENSVLLNRVTKSSILRVIGVQVGDMPKEQVGPHLTNIKSLIEQKTAINTGASMSEYNNPGPVENCIYIPMRGEQGAITAQQIGGDVDVKSLADLEYFRDKMFGALRAQKQYFGFSDDAAGFNGGSSIAQNSIRYARTIKRIQMSLIQAITDAVNLMLIDKGLDNYVNRFTIKMLPPMTQAEVDRQDTIRQQMGVIQDVMNLVSDIDNQSIKLQILKTLLSTVITEPTVMQLIQEQIDVLEQEGEKAPTEEENVPHDDFGGVGIGRDLEREEEPAPTEEPIDEPSEEPSDGETVDRLPNPDELNAGDFTDSDNPDFI